MQNVIMNMMKRCVNELKNIRKKIYTHKSNRHRKNTYKVGNNIRIIKIEKMKRCVDELKNIRKNIYAHKVTDTKKIHIK